MVHQVLAWKQAEKKKKDNLTILRPNLKNLSRGLNLNCGSNMVGSIKIVFNFSRFKPALN